jgi:hypothetical protein
MAAAATCNDAGAAPRLVRTWEMQGRLRGRGRPAGGLEQRSSQAASGARGLPATFSLPLSSPALAANGSRSRFAAQRAYLGGRVVDFPRLLLFARVRGRFPAGPRSFWRPSPLPPRISTRRLRRGCRRPPDAYLRLIRLGGRHTSAGRGAPDAQCLYHALSPRRRL